MFAISKSFLIALAILASGEVCRGEAPVEGDRALLQTLIDAQATNLTLYPRGELSAEVTERISGLEAKATVVWDGDRTYMKYRLKQVIQVPVEGKPGETEAKDSVQEWETIEIPGEYMMYSPKFLQCRRYVQHTSGDGYVRELKLRPEQQWYRYEGIVNLNELIDPTFSRRTEGVTFVVKREPRDQVVVERHIANGCYVRFVASLAAGGNITGFEVMEPTSSDMYGKQDYSWTQDSEGRWYLRELRWQEAAKGDPQNIRRDLRIKVTHFNAEPLIRNNRFSFSSFDLAEGTVVEDGLVLGNRAAAKNLRTYRVGGNGTAKKGPSESELDDLADKARAKGFSAPEKKSK